MKRLSVKLVSFLLVLAMLLSLAVSCGKKPESDPPAGDPTPPTDGGDPTPPTDGGNPDDTVSPVVKLVGRALVSYSAKDVIDTSYVVDGEFVTLGGKTYYIENNVAAVGNKVIDGKIYCFGDDGAMITGERNGLTYSESGALVADDGVISVKSEYYRYTIPMQIMEEDFINYILNPAVKYYEDLFAEYAVPDGAAKGITVTESDYKLYSKSVWSYTQTSGFSGTTTERSAPLYDEYGNINSGGLMLYVDATQQIVNRIYPATTSTGDYLAKRNEIKAASVVINLLATAFVLIEPANEEIYGEGGAAYNRYVKNIRFYEENPDSSVAIYVCIKSIANGDSASMKNISDKLEKYSGYTPVLQAVHEAKCLYEAMLGLVPAFAMLEDGVAVVGQARVVDSRLYIFGENGFAVAQSIDPYEGITYAVGANGYVTAEDQLIEYGGLVYHIVNDLVVSVTDAAS